MRPCIHSVHICTYAQTHVHAYARKISQSRIHLCMQPLPNDNNKYQSFDLRKLGAISETIPIITSIEQVKRHFQSYDLLLSDNLCPMVRKKSTIHNPSFATLATNYNQYCTSSVPFMNPSSSCMPTNARTPGTSWYYTHLGTGEFPKPQIAVSQIPSHQEHPTALSASQQKQFRSPAVGCFLMFWC